MSHTSALSPAFWGKVNILSELKEKEMWSGALGVPLLQIQRLLESSKFSWSENPRVLSIIYYGVQWKNRQMNIEQGRCCCWSGCHCPAVLPKGEEEQLKGLLLLRPPKRERAHSFLSFIRSHIQRKPPPMPITPNAIDQKGLNYQSAVPSVTALYPASAVETTPTFMRRAPKRKGTTLGLLKDRDTANLRFQTSSRGS